MSWLIPSGFKKDHLRYLSTDTLKRCSLGLCSNYEYTNMQCEDMECSECVFYTIHIKSLLKEIGCDPELLQ